MAKAIAALDYLEQPDSYPIRPVCVVFGNESFLKRRVLLHLRERVLGSDEGDFSLATFDGPKTAMKDVLSELSTRTMFGSGKRFVVVEEADALDKKSPSSDFISRFKQNLEDYIARPASTSVLVLVADRFPGNTRLFKAVAAEGLAIDCAPITKVPQLVQWVTQWGRKAHDLRVSRESAELLGEMVGTELGLLDQELAKLANLVDKDRKVTVEMVHQAAGSWRIRTVWDMVDAALDGKVTEALGQLEKLLLSGEDPEKLFAQIAAPLRRLAAATRLVYLAESAGQRANLQSILKEVGVNSFFLKKTERQLRRLGRKRGEQLYQWLIDTNLDLHGDSSLPKRLILERLIVRVAAQE